jgi:transposase
LERRRLQAADLFAQGKTKAEVAYELGVSAQAASRWYARWLRGGTAGMRTARRGKPAQLGPAELAKIRRVLDRGAVAAGFDNDQWTLARVAEVIERVTGVGHHAGHVWRILKQMRWSLQRPARKAVERNEQEIARWVAEEWPRMVQHPNAQSLALLRRRIGSKADSAGPADLGTQGRHAGAAPPLPAWQADLDVRPGGVPAWRARGRAGGVDGVRPAEGAPTTPGSSSACWTAWATTSTTSR